MKREQILAALKEDRGFDLLVVGGGATGCGIGLDAASRGLSVALVEKSDFAEGTSGRSTKLIHGGVRYLELAVKHLDKAQLHLVRDALRERGILLRIAPHLCRRLSLVTPLNRWAEVPYVYSGLKLYDALAGRMGIGHSRLLSRGQALRRFPMLRGENLKAGVLYYDGQFNDARMNVALALTALDRGAVVLNHVEVEELSKERGRISGASVRDRMTGERWAIRATAVVNAAGPFVDEIRKMDDPGAAPLLRLSAGVHIVLDGCFAPPDTGLLIPRTEDGRVLFVLPWEGLALIGTTDEPAELAEHPRPREEEIEYLLRHVRKYFDLEVTRGDVKAAWSGLRPLVSDPRAADTARLARDHVLEVSPSGLLTITGGKWTTYRKMACDVVDQAARRFRLAPARGCWTDRIKLVGGEHYDPSGAERLAEKHGLDPDVAGHLHRAYGDRAEAALDARGKAWKGRLVGGHSYLEAEVVHAVRNELAVRAIDVLARRLPLALLDQSAAREAAPKVIEIMARELGWTEERRTQEAAWVEQRLDEGL